MKTRLLVVDDEIDMLRLLKRSIAQDLDCEVEIALSGSDALQLIQSKPFDMALVDIRMPGMDGVELLERIKQLDPWLTVVMMTAYGIIEIAVESIKKGAYDFITKPFEHDDLILITKKALERGKLLRENLNLRKRIKESETFQNFIGVSTEIQKIYDKIQMISKTDVTVLITGKSGTGKNLAAMAIHDLSSRSTNPFVRVSCPNVPENILESELFGYAKGAFTHALKNKNGLFKEANGGTIFLDEIGDISSSVQAKLLQVLENKEFKPLGHTKTLSVDVRIIASTNSDLETKMEQNDFREDLFYRLCVVDIKMPPLDDRKEDIPLLVEFFLTKYCTRFNRKKKQISPELMEIFLTRSWNGNVRELANILKKAVIMAPGDEIKPIDIGWNAPQNNAFSLNGEDNFLYRNAKRQVLHRFNIRYISSLLKRADGNVTKAAQMCGLERQSLQQIMKKTGITSDEFRKGANN